MTALMSGCMEKGAVQGHDQTGAKSWGRAFAGSSGTLLKYGFLDKVQRTVQRIYPPTKCQLPPLSYCLQLTECIGLTMLR